MKHPVTWFLLADESFARILENTERGEGLHQLDKGTFHASTETDYSDDEGRTQGSFTKSRPRLDKPQQHAPEAEQFAQDLIKTLEQEQKQGRFDRLAISASPAMLGILRSKWPKSLKKVLKVELNKELVRVPTNDIEKHFTGLLRF